MDETLSPDELYSSSSSERDLVVDDDSNALHSMALFSILEIVETEEERNNLNLPSNINLISDDLHSRL